MKSILLRRDGVVSVFICIVLSALLLFMGVMLDLARISHAEIQQEDLAVISIKSAMSQYMDKLYSQYKLYGMESGDKVIKTMKELYENNNDMLSESFGVSFLKTDVKAIEYKTLGDNGELKRQILNERVRKVTEDMLGEIFGKITKLANIKSGNLLDIIPGEVGGLNDETKSIIDSIEAQTEEFVLGAAAEFLPSLSGEEADYKDTENFVDEAVSLFVGLGRDFTENVLINEYIITYLKEDAELIITGIEDESIADTTVKAMIMGIRVVLNIIYFLTDPELMSQAATLATLAAGITILGVPVAQALIIVAWSTAEAYLDVSAMMDGAKVPLYKSKGTWVLSAFGMAKKIGEELKKQAVELAKQAADGAVDSLAEYVESVVRRIGEYAESAVDDVVNMIAAPLDEAIENAGDYVSSEMKKLRDTCVKNLNSKKKKANIFTETACRFGIEFVEETFDKIDKLAEDKEGGIKGYIKEVKDELKDFILKPVKKVEKDIIDEIEEAKENGKAGIDNKIDELFGKDSSDDGKAESSDMSTGKLIASFCKFGYEDYLRFFLMTKSDSSKINGIRAAINKTMSKNGNSDFCLEEVYSAGKVSFSGEINYYFIIPSMLPDKYKSSDRKRHLINTDYSFGYYKKIEKG